MQEIKPKISIVTVSARPGFIGDAVRNLQKQIFKDFEWIIVDKLYYQRERSVKEFMKDKDITYLHVPDKLCFEEHPYHLGNALNTGLLFCRGDLTVWWQDFIKLQEDALTKLWKLHINKGPCMIACGDERVKVESANKKDDMIDLWNKEPEIVKKEVGCFRCTGKQDIGIYTDDTDHGKFELNFAAVSMKIMKELGGYDETLDEGFNYDNNWLAWRALKLGYPIIFDETNIATMYNHWDLFDKEEYIMCCKNRQAGVNKNAILFNFLKQETKNVKMLPFHINEKT